MTQNSLIESALESTWEQRGDTLVGGCCIEDGELMTAQQAAVIEFEPQVPHNNTTGEMHEKMIMEQQENGPMGEQDIIKNQFFRNSIEYKDRNQNNFMHNPNEDHPIHAPIKP